MNVCFLRSNYVLYVYINMYVCINMYVYINMHVHVTRGSDFLLHVVSFCKSALLPVLNVVKRIDWSVYSCVVISLSPVSYTHLTLPTRR